VAHQHADRLDVCRCGIDDPHDLAMEHHRDAIGDIEKLFEFFRNHHDRDAGIT